MFKVLNTYLECDRWLLVVSCTCKSIHEWATEKALRQLRLDYLQFEWRQITLTPPPTPEEGDHPLFFLVDY